MNAAGIPAAFSIFPLMETAETQSIISYYITYTKKRLDFPSPWI